MNTRFSILFALLALPFLAPRAAAQSSERPADSATIKGRPVDLLGIRGTEVLGRDGYAVGAISDVVMANGESEVAFFVVRSDGWFHRDAALIPAAAVVLGASPEPKDLPRLDARAWWDGRRIQLSLEEREFDDLATYQEDGDIGAYLERNASAVAGAFGLSRSEAYDDGASYELAFRATIGGDASDAAPVVAAPPPEPLSRSVAQDRSDMRRDPSARSEAGFSLVPPPRGDGGGVETLEAEDDYFAIGGQTLAARALIGVPVVNGADEELGSVDDIVVNVGTGEAEFLVVETDEWFRDKAALLPVAGVEIERPSVAEPGAVGSEGRTRIAADISSQSLQRIADFAEDEDVTRYIRSRGAELTQRLGSGKSLEKGARYRLVFGPSGSRG